jgi:hypothetical protein
MDGEIDRISKLIRVVTMDFGHALGLIGACGSHGASLPAARRGARIMADLGRRSTSGPTFCIAKLATNKLIESPLQGRAVLPTLRLQQSFPD